MNTIRARTKSQVVESAIPEESAWRGNALA
jgi:hypothetical protein